MSGILFNGPKRLDPKEVATWAPGPLFVHGRPQRIGRGDYVYVAHRGRVLFRAPWLENRFQDTRPNSEGDDQGPGWAMIVGAPERPQTSRQQVHPRRSRGPGFRYVSDWEQW